VSSPCGTCGQRRLVAVLIPGHEDVEAVVCLACGALHRDVAIARTPTAPEDDR
jgi:transcription elongation factor Elf1